MWKQVDIANAALLERWVAIMRPMNKDYSYMSVSSVTALMTRTAGETWLYVGDRFEIALRFHLVPKRRRYHLSNVGFWGITTPAEVLDLLVEKGYDFMRRQRVASLIAVYPKGLSHEGIDSICGLISAHPRLHVKVVHDTASQFMWTIEQRDMAGSTSVSAPLRLPRVQGIRRFSHVCSGSACQGRLRGRIKGSKSVSP